MYLHAWFQTIWLHKVGLAPYIQECVFKNVLTFLAVGVYTHTGGATRGISATAVRDRAGAPVKDGQNHFNWNYYIVRSRSRDRCLASLLSPCPPPSLETAMYMYIHVYIYICGCFSFVGAPPTSWRTAFSPIENWLKNNPITID